MSWIRVYCVYIELSFSTLIVMFFWYFDTMYYDYTMSINVNYMFFLYILMCLLIWLNGIGEFGWMGNWGIGEFGWMENWGIGWMRIGNTIVGSTYAALGNNLLGPTRAALRNSIVGPTHFALRNNKLMGRMSKYFWR